MGESGATSTCRELMTGLERLHDTVLILFGSQTGVSLMIARQLLGAFRESSISANLGCLNQFEFFMSRRPSTVIFVCSSFLMGGPPENAVKFDQYLDSCSTSNIFSDTSYAVLGVGHSQWSNFCGFSKKIDVRLRDFGAKRLCVALEADSADEDQRQISVDIWIRNLINLFERAHPHSTDIEESFTAIESCNATPDQCCQKSCSYHPDRYQSSISDVSPFSSSNSVMAARILYGPDVHEATLVHSDYMCKSLNRRVLHIELKVPPECSYEPGDCVAIPCANPGNIVRSLLNTLSLDGDVVVSVSSLSCSCTLQWALTYYLDICSLPSKVVIAAVAKLASLEESTALLSVPMERLRENFTNITDIFAQYSSARPTANELCDLLPPLALRYYSIASSPFRHPSTVHLTVAISEHAKQLVPSCSSFRGLCTYWLETCHLGRCTDSSSLFKIPLFIRHNRQLRLPPLDRLPSLVMIGCGVGVAPFRSFLQHLPEGSRQVFLFFGFRDNKDEFLYQREWETSQAITRIDLAFSRIDSHPYRYVQDALKARSEEVAGLISSNAIFYVCGTLSMATAVFECFISDILGRTGGLSRAQAIEVMENKIHQGKYMAEAWD